MLDKDGKRSMKSCSCKETGQGTNEEGQTTRFIPYTEKEKKENEAWCSCQFNDGQDVSRVF